MTPLTPEAEEVLDDLRFGARKIADLASVHAWPRRTVESAIQELRLAGTPIVSDGEGVRLARNAAEAARCAASLRRRAIHQLLTARAVRRAARRMREAEENVEPLRLWDAAS